MMHMTLNEQASIPPPAYHRAQARLGAALHLDALTLIGTQHLLTLYHLASATYTATIIVGLAAQHAGRPELIRSTNRILPHIWKGL